MKTTYEREKIMKCNCNTIPSFDRCSCYQKGSIDTAKEYKEYTDDCQKRIREKKAQIKKLEAQNIQLSMMEEDAQNYVLKIKRELDAYKSFSNKDIKAQVDEYLKEV